MSSVEPEAVERVKRHLEKQRTHDVVEERVRPDGRVVKRRAIAKASSAGVACLTSPRASSLPGRTSVGRALARRARRRDRAAAAPPARERSRRAASPRRAAACPPPRSARAPARSSPTPALPRRADRPRRPRPRRRPARPERVTDDAVAAAAPAPVARSRSRSRPPPPVARGASARRRGASAPAASGAAPRRRGGSASAPSGVASAARAGGTWPRACDRHPAEDRRRVLGAVAPAFRCPRRPATRPHVGDAAEHAAPRPVRPARGHDGRTERAPRRARAGPAAGSPDDGAQRTGGAGAVRWARSAPASPRWSPRRR